MRKPTITTYIVGILVLWIGVTVFVTTRPEEPMGADEKVLDTKVVDGKISISATDTQKIDTKVSEIVATQDAALSKDGKYKMELPKETDGFTYETHEMVHPDGSKSFQIFIFKEVDGKRFYKTVGGGTEAEYLNMDWRSAEHE